MISYPFDSLSVRNMAKANEQDRHSSLLQSVWNSLQKHVSRLSTLPIFHPVLNQGRLYMISREAQMDSRTPCSSYYSWAIWEAYSTCLKGRKQHEDRQRVFVCYIELMSYAIIFEKATSTISICSQPELHFSKWVGNDVLVRPNIFWATLTRRKAEVKVKKDSTEDDFDHIGRQKSSRTRIFAVAEMQCVQVSRRESVFVCMSFLLPHSIVSKSVKDLWIGYARVSLLVSLDGHKRMCSLGDDGSVGEGSLLKESSLEADCHHGLA